MKFLHHQVALDCPMILIQRLLGLGKGLFGNFQCTGPLRALQPFTLDAAISSTGSAWAQLGQSRRSLLNRFGNPTRDHPKQNTNLISKEPLVLAGTPFTEMLIFLQLVTNATQLRASVMLRAWFSETYWTSSWRKNHHSALFHRFNMFNIV